MISKRKKKMRTKYSAHCATVNGTKQQGIQLLLMLMTIFNKKYIIDYNL